MTLFNIQALQGALLSGTYTVLDYAQTGLIAAVFFFKVSMAYLGYYVFRNQGKTKKEIVGLKLCKFLYSLISHLSLWIQNGQIWLE